jgi:hypothetical protein
MVGWDEKNQGIQDHYYTSGGACSQSSLQGQFRLIFSTGIASVAFFTKPMALPSPIKPFKFSPDHLMMQNGYPLAKIESTPIKRACGIAASPWLSPCTDKSRLFLYDIYTLNERQL